MFSTDSLAELLVVCHRYKSAQLDFTDISVPDAGSAVNADSDKLPSLCSKSTAMGHGRYSTAALLGVLLSAASVLLQVCHRLNM